MANNKGKKKGEKGKKNGNNGPVESNTVAVETVNEQIDEPKEVIHEGDEPNIAEGDSLPEQQIDVSNQNKTDMSNTINRDDNTMEIEDTVNDSSLYEPNNEIHANTETQPNLNPENIQVHNEDNNHQNEEHVPVDTQNTDVNPHLNDIVHNSDVINVIKKSDSEMNNEVKNEDNQQVNVETNLNNNNQEANRDDYNPTQEVIAQDELKPKRRRETMTSPMPVMNFDLKSPNLRDDIIRDQNPNNEQPVNQNDNLNNINDAGREEVQDVNNNKKLDNSVSELPTQNAVQETSLYSNIIDNFINHAKSLEGDSVITGYQTVPSTKNLMKDNIPSTDVSDYDSFQTEFHHGITDTYNSVSYVIDKIYDKGNLSKYIPNSTTIQPSAKLSELKNILESESYLVNIKVINRDNDSLLNETEDMQFEIDKDNLKDKLKNIQKAFDDEIVWENDTQEQTFNEFKDKIFASNIIEFSEDERKYVEIFYCFNKIGSLVEKELKAKGTNDNKLKQFNSNYQFITKSIESILRDENKKNPKLSNLSRDFSKLYQKEHSLIKALEESNLEVKDQLDKEKQAKETIESEFADFKKESDMKLEELHKELETRNAEILENKSKMESLLKDNQEALKKVKELEDNIKMIKDIKSELEQTNKMSKEYSSRIEDKDREITRLNNQIATLELTITKKNEELDKLKKTVADDDLKIEELRKGNNRYDAEIERLKNVLRQTEKEKKEVEVKMEADELQKTVLITDRHRNNENIIKENVIELKQKIEELEQAAELDKQRITDLRKDTAEKVNALTTKENEYVQQIRKLEKEKNDLSSQIETAHNSKVKLINLNNKTKSNQWNFLIVNGLLIIFIALYLLYTRSC